MTNPVNKEGAEFEVIDRYGARWRYKTAEGYSWAYAVRGENHDVDDRNCVEVWHEDADEDTECVAQFPFAAMVGNVTPNTCMNLNLRELEPEWVREMGHLRDKLDEATRSFSKTLSERAEAKELAAGYREDYETSAAALKSTLDERDDLRSYAMALSDLLADARDALRSGGLIKPTTLLRHIDAALTKNPCPHGSVQQTITDVQELRIDTETRCTTCDALLKSTKPEPGELTVNVPDGWKLVPLVATDEMVRTVVKDNYGPAMRSVARNYAEMVKAAPSYVHQMCHYRADSERALCPKCGGAIDWPKEAHQVNSQFPNSSTTQGEQK